MPTPGPQGLRRHSVRDEHSNRRHRPASRGPLGAERVIPERTDAERLQAAIAAIEAVKLQMELQAINQELHGVGMYQGSAYEPTAKQKAADKAKLKKTDIGVQITNCITLVKDAVVAYQDTLMEPWGQITKRAEDAEDRGTTLLKEFRKRSGATTVYVIAKGQEAEAKKARRSRLGPSKAHPIRGIHTKQKYDIRLPLDEFISQKEAETKLSEVPFGLGITVDDWGLHTFVYSYNDVYEVHYKKGPRSKKVFEKSSLQKFMEYWGSVVIAVPPGPWTFGSPTAKK